MSTSSVPASSTGDSGARPSSPFAFEGWFILLLGALSAGLLGSVVGAYAIDTDPAAMATLATAGYLAGYFLARTLLPDIAAHWLSFLCGIFLALIAIDPNTLWEELRAGEWRLALDRYEELLRGSLASIDSGARFDSDVAVFAIGLTMWLVGYSAAWMLFRRGWIFWSLALPGAILLVTLALERDRPSWPALLYLGLALAMAAGHTAVARSVFWRSRAIAQPATFGRRSIVLGSLIAALAVGAGLYYSFDLDDRLQERAVESGDRLASWITENFDQSNPGGSEPLPATGNYGAFSDQFKVGDGVPTGDSPLAVMQAGGEEYLAARRLNEYDGSGWLSSTSSSGDETTPAPRIAFQSDQPMNLPRDELQFRAQDQASIVLLQPTDQLLFTIDQHFSASVPTLVRVGWESIDITYQLGEVDIAAVPVDIRELVALLQSAEFTSPGATDVPEFVSAEMRSEFDRVQIWLLQSYPVAAELNWGEDGHVQVHLKGRLPVYSDIAAVYGKEDLAGQSYSVVGLIPQMTAAELAASGSAYPDYIKDSYLGLPETVTQETRDLAELIVAEYGAMNPYDQAIAIQNYLRSNFTYQLDAGPAPSDRDIVDYFLFDSRVGRCDHYASSMAVMLRMLGVPTRIVTGLAPVPFDSEMSGYVYRGRNAHAWVEVYFPGYGWISFEPTPTQQAIGLDQAAPEPVPTPEPTPTPVATTASNGTEVPLSPTSTPTPLAAPAITDTGANGDSRISSAVLGATLGGAVLLTGLFFYFLRRRRAFTGLPVASANYGRLQRLGRYIGVQPLPELTPREYATRFGSARPQSASGAMQVADAYTREQYATNMDPGKIASDSEHGWRDAKSGANDWRLWRRR